MGHRRQCLVRGFTLLELLVAVGLLTLLLAILLPMARRLRQQAMQIKCASNLRQILQATQSYVADNDGFLPQPNYVFAPPAPGWLYTPPINAPSDDRLVETGTLWPYLNNRQVYHCPMVSGPYISGPVQVLTSYLMNLSVIANGAETWSFPVRRMRNDIVLYWEGGEDEAGNVAPDSWIQGASYAPHGLTRRHLNGANIGLINGTVEWIGDEQIKQEQFQYPGRFWCNPERADGR